MKQNYFFKSKRIKRLYTKKTWNRWADSRNETSTKPVVKPNIPPLLWRRVTTQHSVSWRWTGREVCLYINFKSFLLVQNHPNLPKTEWAVLWLSSFSIFPTRLHEVQLLMSRLQQQFLRSQHDRWARFPYEKQNWPPRAKYQNGQILLSSSFRLCIMSPFKTISPIILVPS